MQEEEVSGGAAFKFQLGHVVRNHHLYVVEVKLEGTLHIFVAVPRKG